VLKRPRQGLKKGGYQTATAKKNVKKNAYGNTGVRASSRRLAHLEGIGEVERGEKRGAKKNTKRDGASFKQAPAGLKENTGVAIGKVPLKARQVG